MNLKINSFLIGIGGILAWYMLTLSPNMRLMQLGYNHIEVSTLFQNLVAFKLITVQDGARLAIPEPDQTEFLAWQQIPISKPQQRLMQELYTSAAGLDLRKRITAWNHSRRITAIRDNSVNQISITHKTWRVYNCGSPIPLEAATQVSEAFGYVHQGHLRTGFGKWIAEATNMPCIEWRGRFRATKAVPIEVWYIGRHRETSSWKPKIAPQPYTPPRKPHRLPNCAIGSHKLQQAGSWHIPKSAWKHNTANSSWQLNVRLLLTPAYNPSLEASYGPGVCITEHTCKPQWQLFGITKCEKDLPKPVDIANISNKIDLTEFKSTSHNMNSCKPAKLPKLTSKPQTWHIRTSDGEELLTNKTRPSVMAKKLGLVPLLGIGPQDTHGLGGQLLRIQPAGTLTLTLHSAMQKQAQAALRYGLSRLSATSEGHRAALVLVRTDGAILAAVGHPNPPDTGEITAWDRAAFAKVYPENDPFLVQAWEKVDRHQAAGSTFKPIIALTALTITSQRPEILNMLQGLNPKAFKTLTGLTLTSTKINPYLIPPTLRSSTKKRSVIRNFRLRGRYETLGDLCRKRGRYFNCASPYNLGLASAVRKSLNIWFIALAMLIDGEAADNYQLALQEYKRHNLQQHPVLNLHLTKLLTILGFGTATPLLRNAPPGISLCTKPDQLDLQGSNPTPTRWILAQTAIGQGTAVTPLRMATVAATIAAGAQKVVLPYLDKAWNGQATSAPKTHHLGLDVSLLKNGMQAVIKSGTAHLAFKNTPEVIREHTYAKTGTAQIGTRDGSGKQEPYVSTWMLGWHEPKSQPAFAFACLVTHVDKHTPQRNTGGHVCGPIVAKFLQLLHTKASITNPIMP